MMSQDIAITVEHVRKNFRLPHERQTSIKGTLVNLAKGGKSGYERQEVLKDISFTIQKGEFFGIVGRNGSGKSTLLKMLAGIYTPSSGNIQINGKLTPFIELGVGFNPELTGRENIFLNGALLGFSRSDMKSMYDDIVSFAELSKFMDQKLKNYSSGMQVRLAFSIAIRANQDILLLDEVLAVGDAAFQRKCFDYFMNLKKNKQTVVLVTHDMGAVRQYCDRAVMIDKGDLVHSGAPEEVAQAYLKLFIDEANKDKTSNKPQDITGTDRWGDGRMQAVQTQITVDDNTVVISCTYQANVDLPASVFGFSVYNPSGANLLEDNTLHAKVKTKPIKKGEKVTYDWTVPNIFTNGEYTVSFACCDRSTTNFYDWLNKAATFSVNKPLVGGGLIDPVIITKER